MRFGMCLCFTRTVHQNGDNTREKVFSQTLERNSGPEEDNNNTLSSTHTLDFCQHLFPSFAALLKGESHGHSCLQGKPSRNITERQALGILPGSLPMHLTHSIYLKVFCQLLQGNQLWFKHTCQSIHYKSDLKHVKIFCIKVEYLVLSEGYATVTQFSVPQDIRFPGEANKLVDTFQEDQERRGKKHN